MATIFSLKINGLDELIADAKKAGGMLPQRMYDEMVKSTTMIQNSAKEIGPSSFKNQTGNLRRAIFRRVESAARGVIGVGEKYGEYVENGTRPHLILPKKGKFLAFKGSSGKTIFAKKVNHPGSKPYPFMEPAFEKNKGKVEDNYNKLAEEVVQTLAGR